MKDDELLRYNRQIMLPEVDVQGQEKLLQSRVLIIGLGGLGCPVAMYLAASGVGTLVLADGDDVELSNIQRQIAHLTSSIGLKKVRSAANILSALNPNVDLIELPYHLTPDNLASEIKQADVVVDATDNFQIRFAINRACVAANTPLVSGAAIRFEGQVCVFDSRRGESPCYHCLYREDVQAEENNSCAENGVISPLVGMIGTVQAMETLKLIMHIGEPLVGKLLILDALDMQWRCLTLPKDPHCEVCSKN